MNQETSFSGIREYKPTLKQLGIWEGIKIILWFIAFIMLTITGAYQWFPRNAQQFDWVSFILSIIVTFIPIALAWKNQKQSRWIQTLPNYLIVHYRYKGELVAEFRYIPLAALADARTQAQSLFQAFNGNKKAEIAPMLHEFKSEGVRIDCEHKLNNGRPFELHIAEIRLKKPLDDQNAAQHWPLQNIRKVIWKYPFDDRIKIITTSGDCAEITGSPGDESNSEMMPEQTESP